MRTLILISALFLSLNAKAASGMMDLVCMTEVPTTTFLIQEVGSKVVVELFHHNGVKYAPIFDGVITSNDIGTISSYGQLLNDLGEHQRFEFPRDKCKKEEDMMLSCMGDTPIQNINGHKVEAWAFSTLQQMEKSTYGKYNYTKLTLNMQVDGKDVRVPMRYYEGECSDQLGLAAKKLLKRK
ncbi:hypothetical protein D3C87_242090 [compost metagenome]